MRRQRFPYSLTTPEEHLSSELGNMGDTIQYPYQDTLWPQIITPDSDPIIPYYLYQYPLVEFPSELYPSVSSLYSTSYVNPFESFAYFNEEQPETSEVVPSPPVSGSEYEDVAPIPIPEMFPSEPISLDAIPSLPDDFPTSFPMVTSYGTVTLLLRHLIRIIISPDKSIYVSNLPGECIAAASGPGDKSCVIHPNGRVFHDGGEIHMTTLNRKAKISRRGVVFTSTSHCLSYLVDASGTKTTAEKFRDLTQDFSHQVFFNDNPIGDSIERCYKMLDDSMHKTYRNGDEVWIIGGYRVKQDQWGDIKVSRNYGHRLVRASPTTGHVYMKTDAVEISVSRFPHSYFAVRRGNQQVTASLKGFSVQCGTQKAGFNGAGRLVLK